MNKLVTDVLDGRRRAIARMLTIVENQRAGVDEALAELYPHTGKAWILGVTGAPGTGKSSLVSALTRAYRERGDTVGIIAVDPTSPFTGGAILGDRIRMQDHSGDDGVFIRSMATRGNLGGLSRTTRDAVRVMDAAGFDVVIVETVGAGQSEVDIVRTAYTTLVVEAPGLGDDVQAIKAGILEIADILVVNKSDRPGADQTTRALKAMLDMGHPAIRDQFASQGAHLIKTARSAPVTDALWVPPVVRTQSITRDGISDLISAIDQHRSHLESTGQVGILQERYIEIELYERLQTELMRRLTESLPDEQLLTTIQQIKDRSLDPQAAVTQLLIQTD